jgi:hypothetical protein
MPEGPGRRWNFMRIRRVLAFAWDIMLLLIAVILLAALLAVGAFIVLYLRNGCLDGPPWHF